MLRRGIEMLSDELVFKSVDAIAGIDDDYEHGFIDGDDWREKVAFVIREALAEQAAAHAIELRAYEATVQNLVEALRGVIRVADRDTDEFDVAKAAIMNAVGE